MITLYSNHSVLDEHQYLSEKEQKEIENLCKKIEQDGSMEMTIVILDYTLESEIPDRYRKKINNSPDKGEKGEGLLLLILMEQRQWQFIRGHKAKKFFSNKHLSQIGERNLAPNFKKSDYYAGIRGFSSSYLLGRYSPFWQILVLMGRTKSTPQKHILLRMDIPS